MADIQSIAALLFTSRAEDASTDGDVYLGIGGREFYLDTSEDDYEGDQAGLAPVVGVGSTVTSPGMNDPRSPYPLRTQNLSRFPVYLRLDGTDHWKILYGAVLVYSGPDAASMQVTNSYSTPFPFQTSDTGGMWLGPKAGKWLHLLPGRERGVKETLRKMGLLDVAMRRLPRAQTARRRKK